MTAKASKCAGDLNQTAQAHHFEKWILWEGKGFSDRISQSEY